MNVLFLGLGGIGQRHLRNLLSLSVPDLHIYAYRVRNASFVLSDNLTIREGQALETQYPLTICKSLDEAWEHKIDAVFICNPTSLHREALRQAVEHARSIFVEKPIAESMEGIEEIAALCRKRDVITFVGYQNRFHPCIEKAKDLLAEGAVGRVVAVNAEIGEDVRKWHRYEDYRGMYACRKDLGGGVVLSQIHELDYIPYLLSAMPHSVFAIGGKLSNLEIDVEDVASIMLAFQVEGQEIPVHIHEDYLQSPPSRKCKFIGTKGKLEFDLLSAEIVQYDEDGQKCLREQYDFQRNDMFLKEMKSFLNAAESHQNSCISLQEGAKSLCIAEAVKQSLESKSLVQI